MAEPARKAQVQVQSMKVATTAASTAQAPAAPSPHRDASMACLQSVGCALWVTPLDNWLLYLLTQMSFLWSPDRGQGWAWHLESSIRK